MTVLIAVFSFQGCLQGYGNIRTDEHVTGLFRGHKKLDQYRYYYNGRRSMPWAVIGIDGKYQLKSRFWTPIHDQNTMFGELIDRVYHTVSDLPEGAYILDPSGRQIGIWYSNWRYTTVKMAGSEVVNIYSPYTPESGIHFLHNTD